MFSASVFLCSLHRVGMASRQPPHFLCFAKESKQRKATRRRRPAARGALRCSAWSGKGLELAPGTGLRQSPLLIPTSPALLAGANGLNSQCNAARFASPQAAGVALGALRNRRAAQGKTDKKGRCLSPRTRGRVQPLPVLTEQRRAVGLQPTGEGGRLSFGSVSLAKQRKGTRLSGRRPDAERRVKEEPAATSRPEVNK